jgi:hypothetical protein
MTNRHLTLSPRIRFVEVRTHNSQALCHTPAISDFLRAKIAFALFDQLFGNSIGSHYDYSETRVAVLGEVWVGQERHHDAGAACYVCQFLGVESVYHRSGFVFGGGEDDPCSSAPT